MVNCLLANGADIDAIDTFGKTPLYLAVDSGKEEIASLLLVRGAQVNIGSTVTRQTPLHWAAWNERHDLLELLLQYGADINAQNSDGETALHYAADASRTRTLTQLLLAGADVSIEDSTGETPLHLALMGQQNDAAHALIDARASVRTTIISSAKQGKHSTFHFLVNAGLRNPRSKAATISALSAVVGQAHYVCLECRSLLERFNVPIIEITSASYQNGSLVFPDVPDSTPMEALSLVDRDTGQLPHDLSI